MISNRDLETLRQVASLGELLRDPGKFVALVADAQKSVEELKELLAANATVVQANEYLNKARIEVGAAQEKVEAAKAEQQRILEEMQKQRAEYDAKLEEDMRLNNEAKQALRTAEVAFEKARLSFDAKQQELNTLEARMQVREQNLAAAETAQKDRAAQIAKLARAA